jgi:hypothetical protein
LNADEQCKKIDDRHLVTAADGKKLNVGSQLYEDNSPYLEGILCDNGDEATKCRSSSSPGPEPLTFQKATNFQLDPGLLHPDESNPKCRIDLTTDDTEGDAYTRSLVQHGKACLAVQGDDDQWVVKCVSGDKLQAPPAVLDAVTVSPVSGKMAVKLTFDYNYGTEISVFGPTGKIFGNSCKGTPDAFNLPNTGSLHYEAECRVNDLKETIFVTASGIGENNQNKKTYTLELSPPKVSLQLPPDGVPPPKNEEMEFELQHKASRELLVKEGNETFGPFEVSWFKEVYFEGFPSLADGYKTVSTPSEVNGTKVVKQDMAHHQWYFGVKDFDGVQKFESYESAGIPKKFSFSPIAGTGQIHAPEGDCADTDALYVRHVFHWEAENVKSAVIEGASVAPKYYHQYTSTWPLDQMGAQSGDIYIYENKGAKDVDYSYEEHLTFKWVVTYQDGSVEELPYDMGGFKCHVD